MRWLYTLWVSLEDPDYNITNGGTKSAWPDTVVSLKWQGDWGHLKPAVVGRQLRGGRTQWWFRYRHRLGYAVGG